MYELLKSFQDCVLHTSTTLMLLSTTHFHFAAPLDRQVKEHSQVERTTHKAHRDCAFQEGKHENSSTHYILFKPLFFPITNFGFIACR